MRLPIRNNTSKPLHLFIEITCEDYEVPAGGEAIVTLEDGAPHSIEVWEEQLTIWNEGTDEAIVEISSSQPSITTFTPRGTKP